MVMDGPSLAASFRRRTAVSTMWALIAASSRMEPALAKATHRPTRSEVVGQSNEAKLPPPGLTPAGFAEDQLPPAVVILRVIGLAELQEEMLYRSAALSDEERFAQGLAIGRRQVEMSADLLLTNTKLASQPGCGRAASTLAGLRKIASGGNKPLSQKELLLLAKQYALARDQLTLAFRALPEQDQREGEAMEKTLRAADDEAKQPYWSEEGRFSGGQMGMEGGVEGGVQQTDAEKRERLASLGKVVEESEEQRRRLGQRLRASDPRPEDIQRALYGDTERKVFGFRLNEGKR